MVTLSHWKTVLLYLLSELLFLKKLWQNILISEDCITFRQIFTSKKMTDSYFWVQLVHRSYQCSVNAFNLSYIYYNLYSRNMNYLFLLEIFLGEKKFYHSKCNLDNKSCLHFEHSYQGFFFKILNGASLASIPRKI